jgi:phenylacetate-CoA ligase
MVGTGFLNPVMPMVRYRTADYGAWDEPGPCPACGRNHQRLARIEGRIQEYLVLKDGTRFPATNINAIHSLFFSHIFKFQFVQKEPGRACLRFVPARPLTEKSLAEIRQGFEFFGPMGLELDYEQVSEIPPSGRGKCRIVLTEKEAEAGASAAPTAEQT